MSVTCYTWGNANVLWKDANWIWSMCQITPTPPVVVTAIQPLGVDATTLMQPWIEEPWNPYRAGEREDSRKRWIKLVCKVKGQTFEEEKEMGKSSVSVDDVKMVIEKVTDINVDVKKLEE